MTVPRRHRAFTIIEVLIATSLFLLIMIAIHSSWMAILRGTRAGQEAAKEVQRKRVAMRVIQDALICARFHEANALHYSFVADNSNPDFAALSFVADLPNSFPRDGRYGEERTRRVTVTAEPGKDGGNNLVMRQTPILRLMDEQEEKYPLVLAKNVRLFVTEFLDQNGAEWMPEWLETNRMPHLVRVTLATSPNDDIQLHRDNVIQRVVALGGQAVPAELQIQTARQNNINRRQSMRRERARR